MESHSACGRSIAHSMNRSLPARRQRNRAAAGRVVPAQLAESDRTEQTLLHGPAKGLQHSMAKRLASNGRRQRYAARRAVAPPCGAIRSATRSSPSSGAFWMPNSVHATPPRRICVR